MLQSAIARATSRVASLLVLTVAAGHAQEVTPPAATPVPLPAAVMPAAAGDTVELMRAARSADTVRLERDRFLGERRDAETRWAALRDQSSRLRNGIGEVKQAISAAGAREKLARKEKRDADRILAVNEKRRLDRALDLIEARFDLREAEVEQARIERDFLDASIRANDAELSISERRDQVLANDPGQRTAFQELTSRWLQALRTKSARAYDLEDRRFKVLEAQIELLKRQRN